MRLEFLFGKLKQLRQLPLGAWPSFISGWKNRHKNGYVPCVPAGCRQPVYVSLKEFYETYGYFCEHTAGRHELDYFLSKLKSREVFYDIGAFRGAYSAAARLKLPDAISLHVFEPLPQNAEAIRRVFELNHFNDFKINALAINDGSPLSGSVNERDGMLRLGDIDASATVKFASTSLDEYIASGNQAPTIIKIDVEGFELQVLQGANNCLSKNRPRLWIEVHPDFLATQGILSEVLLDFLRKTGYAISFFDDFNSKTKKAAYHIWCE